jgi:hypothetical protein
LIDGIFDGRRRGVLCVSGTGRREQQESCEQKDYGSESHWLIRSPSS